MIFSQNLQEKRRSTSAVGSLPAPGRKLTKSKSSMISQKHLKLRSHLLDQAKSALDQPSDLKTKANPQNPTSKSQSKGIKNLKTPLNQPLRPKTTNSPTTSKSLHLHGHPLGPKRTSNPSNPSKSPKPRFNLSPKIPPSPTSKPPLPSPSLRSKAKRDHITTLHQIQDKLQKQKKEESERQRKIQENIKK